MHCHALSALVLFVGAPLLAPLAGVGTAEAGSLRAKGKENSTFKTFEYRSTGVEDQDEVAAVTATISSEAGDEDLTFVESDAWLHGAAALSALPSEKATLSLTLYDTGSGTLISFSGARLDGGSITFTADAVLTCDTSSKLGFSSEQPKVDVEVLAAQLYPAEKGYDLAVDLTGADTYAVAYADTS